MSSTAIYGVSVDSRSRNPDEPDNQYTVQLARTMDRVKTIQLGSFQFQDARAAFSNNPTIHFSEPIPVPSNTFMRFYEETTVLTKASGAQATYSRAVTMLIPPTLNPIISMDGTTHEVITALDHGMTFALNFLPEVGLRASIVGGDFPQDLHAFVTPTFPTNTDGPVLTQATLQPPGFYLNQKTFRFHPSYLGELTGGTSAPNMPLRFLSGPLGTTYTSYVYCPPATLGETLTMLNAATTYLNNRVDVGGVVLSATNTTPIFLITAATSSLSSGDQIVVAGVQGNTAANGTWFITCTNVANTYTLNNSAGNGVGVGGTWFSPQKLNQPVTFTFNNNNNTVVVSSSTRVTETRTTITTTKVRLEGTLLYWGNVPLDPPLETTVPTLIERPVELKEGTFTADEVAANTTFRFNPCSFKVESVAERTLHYVLPTGVPAQLVLLYGNYTDAQLVAFMNQYLAVAPAEVVVTYDGLTGKFTFRQTRGFTFGLDFEASSLLVAERLGFDRMVYSGARVYTSVRAGVYGVKVEPRVATYPVNNYTVTADNPTQHYTFRVQQPTRFYVQAGVTIPGTGAAWTPQVFDGEGYAHRFQVGELLSARRPLLSSTQFGAKRISDATNAAPIVVTTAAPHGLTTGDNLTIERVQGNTAANGVWFVTVLTATTFQLDASVGNGAYTLGTGNWWTNVAWVAALGAQVPSAMFYVGVGAVWDASTATPLLSLVPTASLLAAVPEDLPFANRHPLASPAVTDGLILLQPFRRNVFMLHPRHPEGSPQNFGFPPMAWPPSRKTTTALAVISDFPGYNASTLNLPTSSSYTSPLVWNLKPPDYILVVIKVRCAAQDIHSHSYRGTSFPIFAKLLITSPYINVSEEMHFTTLASLGRFNSFVIEFQNPDGTLVNFNGRPHNYTLLFSLMEDHAVLPCV